MSDGAFKERASKEEENQITGWSSCEGCAGYMMEWRGGKTIIEVLWITMTLCRGPEYNMKKNLNRNFGCLWNSFTTNTKTGWCLWACWDPILHFTVDNGASSLDEAETSPHFSEVRRSLRTEPHAVINMKIALHIVSAPAYQLRALLRASDSPFIAGGPEMHCIWEFDLKVEVSKEVRKYKYACDLSANCCADVVQKGGCWWERR